MRVTTLLSEFIKSETIKTSGPQTYTIKDWELVEFKDPKTDRIEKKLALVVDDGQKLLLNKENARTLIEGFGTDETDQWVGRQFEAHHEPSVQFGGKRVGGTRVKVAA